MVIRYRGTSPKLGSCQGECTYPCDYVSFFEGGDVIFLAMMPLRIRFSSSSLLTCCLRSIISLRSFPVTAKAPCTQGCCLCGRTSDTLLHIFIRKKSNIGRDNRVWNSRALQFSHCESSSESRSDLLILLHGIYPFQISLHLFLRCWPKVVSIAVCP